MKLNVSTRIKPNVSDNQSSLLKQQKVTKNGASLFLDFVYVQI